MYITSQCQWLWRCGVSIKMLVKKISLAVAAFFIALPFVKAQERLSADGMAVQQIVIKMFDALSNRDSAGLKLYCTPDIALYENGAAWSLDTLILKAITQNRAEDFKRINTIDFIQTEVNGNTAWVTYNNRAEITASGKQRSVQWLETVILTRDKKNWKIKLLHSTLIRKN
jgi:ketosteroid isomerase-like protein